MRAAEQLFAQQGVDRVSLREIAIAAGQRNVSAATYHFGSKRELIEAILERHSVPVQESWTPTLAADTEHKLTLHQLIELFVWPLVDKIDDADGGVFDGPRGVPRSGELVRDAVTIEICADSASCVEQADSHRYVNGQVQSSGGVWPACA